jgi:glycerol-3-phosphate acyltransferase PlsY
MSRVILIAAASYLLGSIPFGYLLVRIFRGEDVRQSGSGNIGATNVSRKSPVLGVLTLLLDALKGSAAVALASYLSARMDPASGPSRMMSLAALFAVAGHVFPIWLHFRGGKGVATGLGSFVMIAPKAVLVAALIFVVLVVAFRYVSLGSVAAVAAFPLLAWLLHEYANGMALTFISLASLLIVAKHHQNIRRLLAGTENRFGSRPA